MDKIGQEYLENIKTEKPEKGKNLRHITRVTGYLSWTEGWNKGKLAELKDRHRETDTQNKRLFSFDWYDG